MKFFYLDRHRPLSEKVESGRHRVNPPEKHLIVQEKLSQPDAGHPQVPYGNYSF